MIERSLWGRHIFPFVTLTTLLAVVTMAGDYVLHRFNLVWVGRYLGIPGTLLIAFKERFTMRWTACRRPWRRPPDTALRARPVRPDRPGLRPAS